MAGGFPFPIEALVKGADNRADALVARATEARPTLLIADGPTLSDSSADRDAVLRLLRSIADDGVAVLMSNGKKAGTSHADRALTISRAALQGATSPHLAPVVGLHAQPASAARARARRAAHKVGADA